MNAFTDPSRQETERLIRGLSAAGWSDVATGAFSAAVGGTSCFHLASALGVHMSLKIAIRFLQSRGVHGPRVGSSASARP